MVRNLGLVALAALIALAAAGHGVALAHQPFFNDAGSPSISAAYQIRDPHISKAIFGAIRQPGSVDYYRLELTRDLALDARLLVPDQARCAAFSPQLALISPDAPPGEAAAGLEIPGGMAAYGIISEAWGSWSGHGLGRLREGQPLRARLSQGTHYLAVYDRSGAAGAYLLSLGGGEERGGDADAPQRMRAWERCDDGAPPPAREPWVRRVLLWLSSLLPIRPMQVK